MSSKCVRTGESSKCERCSVHGFLCEPIKLAPNRQFNPYPIPDELPNANGRILPTVLPSPPKYVMHCAHVSASDYLNATRSSAVCSGSRRLPRNVGAMSPGTYEQRDTSHAVNSAESPSLLGENDRNEDRNKSPSMSGSVVHTLPNTESTALVPSGLPGPSSANTPARFLSTTTLSVLDSTYIPSAESSSSCFLSSPVMPAFSDSPIRTTSGDTIHLPGCPMERDALEHGTIQAAWLSEVIYTEKDSGSTAGQDVLCATAGALSTVNPGVNAPSSSQPPNVGSEAADHAHESTSDASLGSAPTPLFRLSTITFDHSLSRSQQRPVHVRETSPHRSGYDARTDAEDSTRTKPEPAVVDHTIARHIDDVPLSSDALSQRPGVSFHSHEYQSPASVDAVRDQPISYSGSASRAYVPSSQPSSASRPEDSRVLSALTLHDTRQRHLDVTTTPAESADLFINVLHPYIVRVLTS